jgi:hypothetical protein
MKAESSSLALTGDVRDELDAGLLMVLVALVRTL